jgi:O-antigen/teichoic acid export membrane protein
MEEVQSMYKKSSDILLITGGLLFLLININIVDLYQIIDKPEYSVGVYIVLMVSISELYKLALGTNGAILANSAYYKMFFYFSIAMAISVIVLNKVFIDLFGIDGAALATLLVVLIFSTIKLVYINSKLKMHPFSTRTNKIMVIITVLFFIFYFLQFNINPFLSILIKSIVLILLFSFAIIKLKLSDEINEMIRKYL